MKLRLIAAACGVCSLSAGADAPNYYTAERPAIASVPDRPVPQPISKRKQFIVEGDSPEDVRPQSSAKAAVPSEEGHSAPSAEHVQLPPNMERGIKELEAGVHNTQGYTVDMAAHLQKNGMRGFLAVPPELKNKGRNVGKQIGGGINGIMTDVGQEMVTPQPSH